MIFIPSTTNIPNILRIFTSFAPKNFLLTFNSVIAIIVLIDEEKV